jgi:hypothetical protein
MRRTVVVRGGGHHASHSSPKYQPIPKHLDIKDVHPNPNLAVPPVPTYETLGKAPVLTHQQYVTRSYRKALKLAFDHYAYEPERVYATRQQIRSLVSENTFMQCLTSNVV